MKNKQKMINDLNKSKKFRKLNSSRPFHKFVFFQNIKDFNITSLVFENFNPEHKYLVRGKKKDNPNNYEKVCLLVRLLYISYVIGICFVIVKVVIDCLY